MNALLLVLALIPRADFRSPDPSLASYSLAPVESVQLEPPEEPSEPSFWWRATGWGVYLACGSAAISGNYRRDRTFGAWKPSVDNDIGRYTLFAGIGEASNRTSEWLVGRDDQKLGLMSRIGTLAACSYTAVNNFHKGWTREP